MAADQRRKRMNSANVIGFSSREHYRAKRKKVGSQDGALRSSGDHISLEWDRNRSKVVSKKEQVGLSFRHLREFVGFVPSTRRNLLAQVFPVPHETFQLENLSDVLTNEVWRSFLSDDERSYLKQFLPKGIDVEQVVQQLLDGENFHFGNPFLDWGTSVCSGKAHPDQIVSKEKRLRDGKRRHYLDLENYHNEAIDYLQTLKEKWESCKDTDKDAFVWGRSRRGIAVNDSFQNLSAASESTSLNADDKPCSSDNKTSSIVRNGGVQRRPKSSAVAKGTSRSPLTAQDHVGKARNKDKVPKHSIQQTDGSKYMSYLKISKKQHQIVTSMKQSGKSIQSRELNQILGNINNLDVQPYGMFVEEEQKKLNAHWLQLVKDLPAAYAIWKKLQLQKRDIVNSLERDLKEKLNPWTEVHPAENTLQKDDDFQLDLRSNDHESLNPSHSGELAPDVEDSGSLGQVSAMNHSLPDSGRCLQVGTYPSQVPSPYCNNCNNSEDIEEKQYSSPLRCHGLKQKEVEANDYSSSMQGQFLPPVSFSHETHTSDLEEAIPVSKNCVPQPENVSTAERIQCIPSSHGEELQFCSNGNVWRPVEEIRHSYNGRQAYTPSVGLSTIHNPERVDEEEKNCFIDQRKAISSFGSFPNNDQNELLQTLFKDQGLASRSTEQQLHSLLKAPLNQDHKQIAGIGFQHGGSNRLMEANQFSGQFQHQMTTQQAMSQGQHRQIDIYGQGNMPGNIYSDGRGFLMQRPEWNTNVAQIGVTTHPHLNTVPLLNESWQYKSMWPNTNVVGFASQGSQTRTGRDQNLLRVATNSDQITHRGNSSDQSLFSVLSQCSQLRRSRSAFEPELSSDQVVTPGNYGMMMGGVGTSQVGSNLVQPTNPLDYLSGSNPSTSLMPDDVVWMNQSRQNSGLHDPLGKLYPRSWNQ